MGYYITNISLNFLVIEFFKIGKNLAKLQAKWFIVTYAPFVIHFWLQRCRTHQISKITCVLRTETVTSCCYVNRQMNKLIINKYQTAVDQFWLTDRVMPSVTDQLLIVYGRLLWHLFFVTAIAYSQSWHFYVVDVNNFLLVN